MSHPVIAKYLSHYFHIGYNIPIMNKHSFDRAFEVVKSGYDRLADKYGSIRGKFENWNEIEAFTAHLPKNGRVLDAGSGTGVPVAEHLDRNGFNVVGIDISDGMIATARKNVPSGELLKMNMVNLDLPPESFDGVISCYAIIHIPKEKHAGIFRSFHRVLKPGGTMLVSVACWEWEEYADYLGVDMFWSHFDPEKSKSLITNAGFEIEFGRDVRSAGEIHYWVLAHKR